MKRASDCWHFEKVKGATKKAEPGAGLPTRRRRVPEWKQRIERSRIERALLDGRCKQKWRNSRWKWRCGGIRGTRAGAGRAWHRGIRKDRAWEDRRGSETTTNGRGLYSFRAKETERRRRRRWGIALFINCAVIKKGEQVTSVTREPVSKKQICTRETCIPPHAL